MSGFFSLTGKSQQQQQDHQQSDNNYSLFLLNKNEEIYNKGFELWHHPHQQTSTTSVQDVGFSIGPSSGRSSSVLGFRVMNNQGRGGGGNEGLNCQDCGNQAKKDCEHMRCRTCCKSRGFPCQTHVKSTWVPAAKRRERHQLTVAGGGGDNSKRMRETGGAGGSGSGGGGFELGRFPAEVNSPAVFRCVRVSAMDDAEEHLAYQTAVNIGGHVFKGILYDQGPESRYPGGGAGEGPSHQQPPLDLIATSGATSSNPNVPMLDPSIYTPHLSSFMAGTQFFLPPRP